MQDGIFCLDVGWLFVLIALSELFAIFFDFNAICENCTGFEWGLIRPCH